MMITKSAKYPKLYGPYKRFTTGIRKNYFDVGKWFCPEFEALKDLRWEWTEKINGMNVRVLWDGYKISFAGRTDGPTLWPSHLLELLNQIFSETLMEQQFGSQPAILYGEGFGAGVVKGSGVYGPNADFALFDVCINGFWLERSNLEAVSRGLGIATVPIRLVGTVNEAILDVAQGLRFYWGPNIVLAEGLVGKAPCGLLNRKGERIMMKIRSEDFYAGT